jgi:DNA-binding MarR family transcriptional regulator
MNPRATERLTGEDLQTWAALATLLEWLPSALDEQLQRDSGVSHFEYGLMYALASAEDRTLRMSVLAGYANSSLSRLSRAVTRLESKGWVRRRPDPGNGRYNLAILTDLGAHTVEEATPGHVRTVHRLVLDPLTATQKRQLREASRRIMRAIKAEGEWEPVPQAEQPTSNRLGKAPRLPPTTATQRPRVVAQNQERDQTGNRRPAPEAADRRFRR